MATHCVTLGRYPGEFDASCETGRLRARERLTPWPGPEICCLVPSTPAYLRATSDFLFVQSKWQRQMWQAAAVQRQAALWQQFG